MLSEYPTQARLDFIYKWLHTPNACPKLQTLKDINFKNQDQNFRDAKKQLKDFIKDMNKALLTEDPDLIQNHINALQDYRWLFAHTKDKHLGNDAIKVQHDSDFFNYRQNNVALFGSDAVCNLYRMINDIIKDDASFAKHNVIAITTCISAGLELYTITKPKVYDDLMVWLYGIIQKYKSLSINLPSSLFFNALFLHQQRCRTDERNFPIKDKTTGNVTQAAGPINTNLKSFLLGVCSAQETNFGVPPNYTALSNLINGKKAILFTGNEEYDAPDGQGGTHKETQFGKFLKISSKINILSLDNIKFILNSLGFATTFVNKDNEQPFKKYKIPDKTLLEHIFANENFRKLEGDYTIFNYARYKLKETPVGKPFIDEPAEIVPGQQEEKYAFLALAENPNFTTIDDLKAIENLFIFKGSTLPGITNCFVKNMSIIFNKNFNKDTLNIGDEDFYKDINNGKRSCKFECFKILLNIVNNESNNLDDDAKTNFNACKVKIDNWLQTFYKQADKRIANSIFNFAPKDKCEVEYNDGLKMHDNALFEYMMVNHKDKIMFVAEKADKIEAGTLLRMMSPTKLIDRKKLLTEVGRIINTDNYEYTKWDTDKYVTDTKQHFVEAVLDFLEVPHDNNYENNIKILKQLLLQEGIKNSINTETDIIDKKLISEVAYLRSTSDTLNVLTGLDKNQKNIEDNKKINKNVKDVYDYVNKHNTLMGFDNQESNIDFLNNLQKKITDNIKSKYENIANNAQDKINQIVNPSDDLNKKYFDLQNAIEDLQIAIKNKKPNNLTNVQNGDHITMEFSDIKEAAKDLKQAYKNFNKAFKKELLSQNSGIDKNQIDKIKKNEINKLKTKQINDIDKLSKYKKYLENDSKDELTQIQSLNAHYQQIIDDIKKYKGNDILKLNQEIAKAKQKLSNEFGQIEENIKNNINKANEEKVKIKQTAQHEVNPVNVKLIDKKHELQQKKIKAQLKNNINEINQEKKNKTTEELDVKKHGWFFDGMQIGSLSAGIVLAVIIFSAVLATSASTGLVALSVIPLFLGVGTFIVRGLQHKRNAEGVNVNSEMKIYEEKFNSPQKPTKTPSMQSTKQINNINNDIPPAPFVDVDDKSPAPPPTMPRGIINSTKTSLDELNKTGEVQPNL